MDLKTMEEIKNRNERERELLKNRYKDLKRDLKTKIKILESENDTNLSEIKALKVSLT